MDPTQDPATKSRGKEEVGQGGAENLLSAPEPRPITVVRVLALLAAGLASVSGIVLIVSLVFVLGYLLADEEPAWCDRQRPASTSGGMELCVAPGEWRRWELVLGTTVMSKSGVKNWSSPTGVTCVWANPARQVTVTSRIRSRVDDERYSEGVISITGDPADLNIGGDFRVPQVPLGENELVTLDGTCTGTVYYPEPKVEPRPHFEERRVDLAVPAKLLIAEKYRSPKSPYPKVALLAFAVCLLSGLAWVRLSFGPAEAHSST